VSTQRHWTLFTDTHSILQTGRNIHRKITAHSVKVDPGIHEADARANA